MSKWARAAFGSLYAIPSRNGLTRPSSVRGEGYRMAAMGEIFASDYVGDSDMDRVRLNERELGVMMLAEHDLLFARQSLVLSGAGKCSIVKGLSEPTTFESHLIRVRLASKKANPLFYMYYFHSPVSPMHSIVQQGVQAGIRASDLEALDVVVPPKEVQDRIADKLSLFDSAIDNARRQSALLEEAAMRLYREWFDGTGKGWKRTPVVLADVLERLGTGLNPRKNFTLGHGENFYVTIKNMANNRVYLDSKCDKVDDEAIRKINRRSDLRKGDVLFSGIGTIGRAYLIAEAPKNWNTSESVFNLRANSRITPEFLYMLMLSSKMQQYAMNNATGCAQKGIRAAALRAYQFDLAPLIEIEKFTEQVRPMLNAVNDLNKKIDSLTEARDRLLPKLMSGEIEV